jgi:hypothetical protein
VHSVRGSQHTGVRTGEASTTSIIPMTQLRCPISHAQHTETTTHTNAYTAETLFRITYILHERVLGQVQVKARHTLNYGIGHHDVCEGADHAVPVSRAGPGRQPASLFVRVQPAFEKQKDSAAGSVYAANKHAESLHIEKESLSYRNRNSYVMLHTCCLPPIR